MHIPDPAQPSIEEKVAFLRRPESYPGRPAAIEVIETHMSWVFLSEASVYKLKKPVRRAFLDFTTLESRRRNCEREVELNRRLARDVYLGIVPLTCPARGGFELGGEGTAVEWLVKMRRLPAHRMLDHAIRAGTVRREDLRKLTDCLARFYRRAERVATSVQAYRGRFLEGIEETRRELAEPHYGLPAPQVEHLAAAQTRFIVECGGMLDARALEDRIVDAHGDLRPEHVCLNAEPRIIDCLEFKRELRLLDPADELAFLAMECERLGAAALGGKILDQCLTAGGDRAPDALISFYKTYRACLRAKIAVWHIADHEIQGTEKWRERGLEYLALAEKHSCRW